MVVGVLDPVKLDFPEEDLEIFNGICVLQVKVFSAHSHIGPCNWNYGHIVLTCKSKGEEFSLDGIRHDCWKLNVLYKFAKDIKKIKLGNGAEDFESTEKKIIG